MSSLFLTMSLLFLIGTQLSWPSKDSKSRNSIRENNEVKEGNTESKSTPKSEGTFPLSEVTTVSRQDPWKIWNQWVKDNHLYPEDMFYSDEMNHILDTMATAQVTSFGLGYRGTQLKASMILGEQRTVFKPKRSVAHKNVEC